MPITLQSAIAIDSGAPEGAKSLAVFDESCEEVTKDVRHLMRVVGVVKGVLVLPVGRLCPQGEVQMSCLPSEVIEREAHEGGVIVEAGTYFIDDSSRHNDVVRTLDSILWLHHQLKLPHAILKSDALHVHTRV